MQGHPEVQITFLASTIFWPLLVWLFYVLARRGGRARAWWQELAAQRYRALGIALVAPIALTIAGFLDLGRTLGGLMIGAQAFCQALIGLALARRIPGFEPLPVTRAIQSGDRPLRAIALMALISLLALAPAFMAGMLGTFIGRGFFGEIQEGGGGSGTFPPNIWQPFFSFLGGAGIAEETPYRLLLLTLFWVLWRRRWLAIVLSGLLFGAYHLTPLDTIYYTFWDYPATQFFSSAFIGMVWGWIYTRRGFETTVLAHTLSNWIPLALFTIMQALGLASAE